MASSDHPARIYAKAGRQNLQKRLLSAFCHVQTVISADSRPSVGAPTLGNTFFPKSISGLMVEYIVAIDVTRARFPADASYLGINGFAH